MDTVARPDGQQIRSILQILLGAENNYLSFKILLLLSFLHLYIYGDRYNFKTAKNHRSVTYRHKLYESL